MKTNFGLKRIAIVAVLTCVLGISPVANSAFAQQSTAERLDDLQQQLDALRRETVALPPVDGAGDQNLQPPYQPYAPLALPAAPKPAPATPAPASAPKPEPKKYPDFKVTGVFQVDSAYFSQSGNSITTLGDIQDGTAFRRARFAATGNISERGSYMMEFDLAQGQPRFVDVWGQVKDTPLGTMRIGRFRQPFGMQELTSIRELPFLERATPFSMTPFRQTGIMFSDSNPDDRRTVAVSGFRTISDNFGNVYGDDGGYGTAERITFLLADRGDTGLFHVGFDHSWLDPARDQFQIASTDEVFVGQQPNFGPASLSVQPIVFVPPLVNTGVFDLDYANLFNVEAAISMGRGLIQSEYRWTSLALPTGEDVTVHGGYAMMRYMLTGETIPYNRATGVFGRVTPCCPMDLRNGGWGAWEVAAQMSTINLNPLFGMPGVPGPTRRLLSSTIGLNWYWNAYSKCQFDWINGSLNDPALGDSSTNTYAARVQFDF